MKLKAIITSLGLSSKGDPKKILYTFSKKPVSNGYVGIVADKESAWIQLSKEKIEWKDMVEKSTTATRQYWTLDIVTIHKQIANEIRICPRPNKLSVKPLPPEPPGSFSKLRVGNYYVHAHQIMTLNKFGERKKLCIRKLVEKLQIEFREAYKPK